MPHSPNRASRAKPPIPLSSFDPRFRNLLLEGAKAPLEVPCASRSEAVRLRQRLNQYRFACKQHFASEAHEWEPLYRCIVQQNGNTLVLRPRDSEFDTALSAAGLSPQGAQILPADFLTNLAKDPEG